MSFADFNYDPAVAGITARLATMQQTLSGWDAEIALLSSAVEYSVTAARIDMLTQQRERLAAEIQDHQAVLDEIAVIQALPAEAKDSLYYFYTVVGVPKFDFMAKMMFNHTTAINSEENAKLMADTVSSPEAKVIIAKLLYNNVELARIARFMMHYLMTAEYA
jgi:hypothetical protein